MGSRNSRMVLRRGFRAHVSNIRRGRRGFLAITGSDTMSQHGWRAFVARLAGNERGRRAGYR